MSLMSASNHSPAAADIQDGADQAIQELSNPIGQKAAKGLSPAALARAIDYISNNLYERFSLSDLARAACMSRYHFARQFRTSMGQTAMRYVTFSRMEEAKRILSRSDQKLSETAAALGFYDQSHFTREFRRMTGLSPGSFRKASGEVGFPRQQTNHQPLPTANCST